MLAIRVAGVVDDNQFDPAAGYNGPVLTPEDRVGVQNQALPVTTNAAQVLDADPPNAEHSTME